MPRKRKEVEEEEGVTRCVCGHEELQNYATKQRGVDPSLFIQCDQCEVWQHGYCVGLTSRDVPEVYYCEECRPDFHDVRTKNGRTTSRYMPHNTRQSSGARRGDQSSESEGDEEPAPRDRRKRRQTMNSREDDILQRVLEQSAREAELLKKKQRQPPKDKDGSEEPELEAQNGESEPENEEDEAEADEEDEGKPDDGEDDIEEVDEAKEEPEDAITIVTVKPEKPEPPAKPEDQEEPQQEQEQEADTEPEPEPKEEEEEEEEEEKPVTPPPKRKRRARARPGPKVAKNSSNAVNGKKCKPKIPSARITFSEMRKRVAMILEFSGHTQTEMIAEDSFRNNMLQDQRKRESNDIVVAQLEDLHTQHKLNISQLEGLTAKLLAWQEKYG